MAIPLSPDFRFVLESVHLAARRLYQIREFAQPNTHVLYLIHQTLSLEENIYEILFQAQNPGAV